MSICQKIQDLEIDTQDIWKDDILNRKEVAEDFTRILADTQQPFVVSVDASYGMGKTFFLNRWREQLKKDGYQVAFFNAWNTDWEKEPLVPFIKTIIDSFPRDIGEILKEKSIEILKSIKDYSNFIIECSGGPENTLKKIAQIINPDDKIEQYEVKQKVINDFRNTICEKIKDNKLFIFVDELERCRPTYAVEVLETIKHIFDIPNVIFILGIDRTQLKHTISALYGPDMDGEGYLKRFVDLELHLPKPNREIFCKVLMDKFAIKNKKAYDSNSIINGWGCYCDYFSILADGYDLSLREISQCFTDISIIQKMVPDNYLKMSPILALLMILKHKKYSIYQNIEKISFYDLWKELEKIINANNDNITCLKHCLMLVMIPFNDLHKTISELENENTRLNHEKQSNPAAAMRQEEIIKKLKDYHNVYQMHDDLDRRFRIDARGIIPYLKQKMEYLSKTD